MSIYIFKFLFLKYFLLKIKTGIYLPREGRNTHATQEEWKGVESEAGFETVKLREFSRSNLSVGLWLFFPFNNFLVY